MPSTAIVVKYTIMTGANNFPTEWVPRFWIRNRPIRRTSAIGMTRLSKPGLTTVSPSTADRTEIAGVIMLSP